MRIENIDRANALVKEIKETEYLIEELRSCIVIRLLTHRNVAVWDGHIELGSKEITSLNKEFKLNLLSYYEAALSMLKSELDKI
jgi:hypothetical protein